MSEGELRSDDKLHEAMKFYDISETEVKVIQAKLRADAVLFLILERIATLDFMR